MIVCEKCKEELCHVCRICHECNGDFERQNIEREQIDALDAARYAFARYYGD